MTTGAKNKTSSIASFDFHPLKTRELHKIITGAQFRGSIKRGNAMDFESPRSGVASFVAKQVG